MKARLDLPNLPCNKLMLQINVNGCIFSVMEMFEILLHWKYILLGMFPTIINLKYTLVKFFLSNSYEYCATCSAALFY